MALKCFTIVAIKSCIRVTQGLLFGIVQREKLKIAKTYFQVLTSLLLNIPAFIKTRYTIQKNRKTSRSELRKWLITGNKSPENPTPELRRCA
jgi:hypothetical protein